MFRSGRILGFLCLLCGLVFGQDYPTTTAWSPADFETDGGVPIWKELYSSPVGICKPKTLIAGRDGTRWCMGISDNAIYKWTSPSSNWVRQTAMGTTMTSLILVSAATIYAIGPQSQATSGDPCYQKPGIWQWSNSSWNLLSYCYSAGSVGSDGFLVVIDMNNGLWKYQNGSWTNISGLGFGWTYISVVNQHEACGINSGTLYTLDPIEATDTATSQPGLTLASCLLTGDNSNDMLVAMGTAGKIKYLPASGASWTAINTGSLTMSSLTGYARGEILGEDVNGHAYHWNSIVPRLTVTMSGTWQNCPNAAHPCSGINPTPTHTLTVTAKAAQGGLNSSVNTQTTKGNPQNKLTATAYDDFGQCDMEYGALNDPACVPSANDGSNANCSVAGPLGGSTGMPSPPTIGQSIYYGTYSSTVSITPPLLVGDAWHGGITLDTINACLPDTGPTCVTEGNGQNDILNLTWIDFDTEFGGEDIQDKIDSAPTDGPYQASEVYYQWKDPTTGNIVKDCQSPATVTFHVPVPGVCY